MASTTIRQMQFPFLDLKAQYASIRDEVNAAIARVMESQHFIMGPEVKAFEDEVKPQTGAKFVYGCASGSDALLLALMALGVGPGDEVIAPPFTFIATIGAIERLHARTVFVDIDPDTFNLSPKAVAKAITPKTKAIIPVHLFGLSADLDPILEAAAKHKVPVIEDAAQAIGAQYKGKPVGSMGAIGCFSFFPSKNLGGAGDGGLLSTNDPALADRLNILHVHGSRTKYKYEIVGINSRLDAIQAAILRVKLRYLDAWSEGRRRNADTYRRLFAERRLLDFIKPPVEPAGYRSVYNQFTIRAKNRDGLRAHLQNEGIPTEIYYPHSLHTEPAFAHLGYKSGAFPESEKAAAEALAIPIFPELTENQLRSVVDAVADFYKK